MKPDKGYITEEFTVKVGKREITPRIILSPEDVRSKDMALLFNFSLDRESSLSVNPYDSAGKIFLEHGHGVISFDLPSHGVRIDRYGQGIEGWCNSFLDGKDYFSCFLEEASAVIDRCIEKGLIKSGSIALSGISRGGYLAFRLLGVDSRIAAAAGFAPVTDWRFLREFSGVRDREDIENLRLECYLNSLAGKHIFVTIGKQDDRVNTESCRRFEQGLREMNSKHAYDNSCIDFEYTDDIDHNVGSSSYTRGSKFLLTCLDNMNRG